MSAAEYGRARCFWVSEAHHSSKEADDFQVDRSVVILCVVSVGFAEVVFVLEQVDTL